MSNDKEIEAEIVAKGLTAPRVTVADVDAEFSAAAVEYSVLHGVLTVAAVKLKNGFIVTGESACASPENFNLELGQKIAAGNAKQKIWGYLGFRLRDTLANG